MLRGCPLRGCPPLDVALRQQRGASAKASRRAVASASSEPSLGPPRLVLLRHGESVEDAPALLDHQRPLTEAGRAACRELGVRLARTGVTPSVVLCSDTLRARQTLEALQLGAVHTRFLGSLYVIAAMDGETVPHLQEIIAQELESLNATLRRHTDTILCIGHNRGWEEAASALSGTAVRLSSPSAAVLQSEKGGWEAALEGEWESGASGWRLAELL